MSRAFIIHLRLKQADSLRKVPIIYAKEPVTKKLIRILMYVGIAQYVHDARQFRFGGRRNMGVPFDSSNEAQWSACSAHLLLC
jgi:hypothetical protein